MGDWRNLFFHLEVLGLLINVLPIRLGLPAACCLHSFWEGTPAKRLGDVCRRKHTGELAHAHSPQRHKTANEPFRIAGPLAKNVESHFSGQEDDEMKKLKTPVLTPPVTLLC